MNDIKAIIFDLDNTILDRTSTFRAFAQALIVQYFSHWDAKEGILERIVDLDEDGYKDKKVLFHELLEEMPWLAKPEHDELMAFYRKEYVNNAILMDQALEVIRHT
ncbi:hypothetical protein L1N85_01795 [Paenibacillus alkaliterrae]|uniref:hypothetical protein n=1 Tax=Paenibacillus alkaliterrae TaxID=320909 RepID=UPI001F17514A|nr:hypothetical protein [Paenibacillus alkaliterrae]MCF2937165.1 hypothetical protein [Paenibacillus alkaliterrae]